MIINFNEASGVLSSLRVGYSPIRIYNNKGKLVYTSNKNYEYINISDISENIINAFVSIEDDNFYSHKGYNSKRIFKALIDNIFNKKSSGASTITQQYIKNAYLTNEKTISRKLKELAYSITLERNYSKDQIMEAYLNTILFGSNIYGINMASHNLFNKKPSEISINEAAYLASIINAPNYYLKNIDKANERKNLVLKRMYDLGYINESEYDINVNTNITIRNEINNINSIYNSYIDYVLENISGDVLDIHTYLDDDIQNELYKIITNEYNIFNDDNLNCAIIVIDNETYGIKALVGNRNLDRLVLNYATDVKLQPGSTIKPILDYAPAIEYLGYTLASIIKDEPYTYKDGTNLKNYDNNYLGDITLRKALSDSRNIPAVKLFNEVGYDKAFSFAKKLGIESEKYYESDAIGGATNGYTLLSLANAYSTFANLGYYKKASAIKKEIFEENEIEYNENPKLVMSESTAFLINSVLHDVFKNSSYNLNNTYLMAKTGQTNFDEETRLKYNIPANATKDSLLIGYTKDLTIGIWVGYNNISYNQYLDRYKKNIPRTIMKLVLGKFSKDNMYYDLLDNMVEKEIEIIDNNVYLSNNGYNEYFIIGTEPLGYYKDNNKV